MPGLGDFVTPPPVGGDLPLTACGQFAVLGEGCPVCGGWLYATDDGTPEGLSGVPVAIAGGWTVCSSPECIEGEQERVATFDERNGR